VKESERHRKKDRERQRKRETVLLVSCPLWWERRLCGIRPRRQNFIVGNNLIIRCITAAAIWRSTNQKRIPMIINK